MFAVFFLAYLEPRELVVVLVWLCQTSLGDIRAAGEMVFMCSCSRYISTKFTFGQAIRVIS